MSGTVAAWKDRLDRFEDGCFWPGPRPMRDELRSDQLIGRDEDAVSFADRVRETSLVVLTGESGVGKSSLLNLRLVPQLEADGFLVLVASDWGSAPSRTSSESTTPETEDFIAGKLALPEGIDSGRGFMDSLDATYGDGVVIILDQFEELIRHQPKLFDDVRLWIEQAIATYQVHIVISMRAEFEHRLRNLEAGPWQRLDFYLNPLSDLDDIRAVIESGRKPDGSHDGVIEPEATDFLVDAWARTGGGLPWSTVGLLHLQSLLYVLWHRSQRKTVTLAQIRKFAEELPEGREDDERNPAVRLFTGSLARAVTYRLKQCEETYLKQAQGDTFMAEGVIGLIGKMSSYLSSGGYKVDQDRRHLAGLVLKDELEDLGFSDELARETPEGDVFRAFARKVDNDEEWLSALRVDLVPDGLVELLSVPSLDETDASAGPMFGLSALAVLVEEFRRYFFALEWLNASALVRITSPREGSMTVVSLVHDGFGRGLTEWAASNAGGPRRAISRLTAAVGETFTWDPAVIGADDSLLGLRSYRLITNLRWRSCRVRHARMYHVVFINCDFRESSFSGCDFEGVTFINCLLDGVTFTGCTVRGKPERPPKLKNRRGQLPGVLPSFIINADEDDIAPLNRYRETRVPGDHLGSWTSGRPATPISDKLEDRLREEDDLSDFKLEYWKRQRGGLVMYGGRLSSLMFAGCTFVEEGVFSLRHVAGTSLEFAEQASGALQLYDVALRGLTVSPPVGRQRASESDWLSVEVTGSQLQSVWFSTPLRGEVRIRDSIVWQLFNASRTADLKVSLRDSPHTGIVNCDTGSDKLLHTLASFIAEDKPRADVVASAIKVDYQSLPVLRLNSPNPPEEQFE